MTRETDSCVLELVQFRLQPGTDPAAFLAAARATEAPLRACPGFRRRQLCADGDDWADLVEWDSLTAAQAAAAAMMAHPAFGPFMAMIAPEGLRMAHLARHWQMAG